MKQAKSRQEIAEEYGISSRTLTRWLHKAELDLPKGLLSPKSQKLIYEKFGKPKSKE
ncbi:helix-turn-helix domain-containing protein [Algoriphagus namhaensis]